MQVQTHIVTRPAMEFDAVPVVMMAHDLAQHHGDTAAIRLNTFMRDVCAEFPRCFVRVIENAQGQIAGFAAGYFTYSFHEGCAGFEIQNFFIREECRGKGLGRQLIASVIRFATSRGCERVSLGAEAGNTDAIRFYESIGFTKGKTAGDVQRFYIDKEHLSLFMERAHDQQRYFD